MVSADAVAGSWRKGCFLLISLCTHAAIFILLGMVVFSGAPEPRESIGVQLVKATQQARKLRRSIPEPRDLMADRADLPRNPRNVAKSPVVPRDIPSQTAARVIHVFQHESVYQGRLRARSQMAAVGGLLAAPKMARLKSVIHSHRGPAPAIHGRLSKLSLPNGPATSPIQETRDSETLRRFLGIVGRQIERSKRYPRWAMTAGFEGRVVVRFTIRQDGTLGKDIQLIASSGTGVLDSAAVAAVREAAPFPTLPPSLSRQWLQIELPMDFRLSG